MVGTLIENEIEPVELEGMTRWIYTVSKSRGTIYVAVMERREANSIATREVAESAWRRSSRFGLPERLSGRKEKRRTTNSFCLDNDQVLVHFTVNMQMSLEAVTADENLE